MLPPPPPPPPTQISALWRPQMLPRACEIKQVSHTRYDSALVINRHCVVYILGRSTGGGWAKLTQQVD